MDFLLSTYVPSVGKRGYQLTAPARAAATHAAVAASASRHECSADRAAWSVAHVDQLFQRVGSVVVARGRSAGRPTMDAAE